MSEKGPFTKATREFQGWNIRRRDPFASESGSLTANIKAAQSFPSLVLRWIATSISFSSITAAHAVMHGGLLNPAKWLGAYEMMRREGMSEQEALNKSNDRDLWGRRGHQGGQRPSSG